MRFISRGSHDAFRECPRAGYWRYLSGPWGEDGTLGLQGTSAASYLAFGSAWHLAAEGLLRCEPAEQAIKPALEHAQAEGLSALDQDLLLALALAWERGKGEEFLDRYEVLSIEEELLTPLTSNVTLYTRADAILRDRVDGNLWVLNWKTAGDVKDWNRKWFYDVQSWTESLAVEAKLGVPVRGCIYMGVWKGPMYQGKTSSRLVSAYKYTARDGSISYGTENNGGGVRFNVAAEKFSFGEGIAAWINWLDPAYLKKYFVESAPQIRQDELVEAWLRQVTGYESDVDHVLQEGTPEEKLDFFWQNWGEMTCGRCDFAPLCTLKTTPEEMLRDGLLKPRKSSPRDEVERKANEPA